MDELERLEQRQNHREDYPVDSVGQKELPKGLRWREAEADLTACIALARTYREKLSDFGHEDEGGYIYTLYDVKGQRDRYKTALELIAFKGVLHAGEAQRIAQEALS